MASTAKNVWVPRPRLEICAAKLTGGDLPATTQTCFHTLPRKSELNLEVKCFSPMNLCSGLQYWFELLLPPSESFRWQILGIAAVNVVICVLLEDVVVEQFIFKRIRSRR